MIGKLGEGLNIVLATTDERTGPKKHPKCRGSYDAYSGDYDCGYHTTLECEYCKYGPLGGRKDPAAKCNQL